MTSRTQSGHRKVPVPIASRRTHLFAAGLLWSLVGLGLATAGTIWVIRTKSSLSPLLLGMAAAAGILKARYILGRSAKRIADRIVQRGDDRCIGGFFSWKTWLLALSMSLFGQLLRRSPLPLIARGTLYVAVGIGLLAASRLLWTRWWIEARSTRS